MAKPQKLGINEYTTNGETEKSSLLSWAHVLLFLSAFVLFGFTSAAEPHASPGLGRQTDHVFVSSRTGEVIGPAYVRAKRSEIISFGRQAAMWLFIIGVVLLSVGAIHQKKMTPTDWTGRSFGKAIGLLFAGGFFGFLGGGIIGFFI